MEAEENPRYLIVRRTQEELFRELRLAGNTRGVIDLLDPRLMIEHLGFSYEEVEEIPSSDPKYQTAGYLDRDKKKVVISRAFPLEQRRMTAMHEVVHIMLHDHIGEDKIHRDRPVDFGTKSHTNAVEREATEIASLCLMSERLVRNLFADTFCLKFKQPLIVDEDVAFHLGISIERLAKMDLCATTQFLVRASMYGRPIQPLHQQLKLSPTAVAIRLEELELVVPARKRGKPSLTVVQ